MNNLQEKENNNLYQNLINSINTAIQKKTANNDILSEKTRTNLYYNLDETIFYCEQLKILLNGSIDGNMYEFLSEAFNVTKKTCNVLNFAIKALRLFR